MLNSELEIGKKVKVYDFLRGDRTGIITELTNKYDIPSDGIYPERNADRWVIIKFDDNTKSMHMAGMIDVVEIK